MEGEPGPIPDELAELAAEYREKLLDAVVETDEALMERYLEGEELGVEEVAHALKDAVTRGELFPVQLWGRYSAAQLRAANPTLLAPNNPIETISRFRVLRATFFDFTALEVSMLHDDEALIVIHYHMGMPAEEAAAFQTMGFFEGLLELAGAREVRGRFVERSWAGDPRTLLELRWHPPPAPRA